MMSAFLRFRLGPLVAYKRLGKTAAQKKAAARRRAERSRTCEVWGRVMAGAPAGKFALLVDSSSILVGPFPQLLMNAGKRTAGFAPGELVKVTYRTRDRKLISVTAAGTGS